MFTAFVRLYRQFLVDHDYRNGGTYFRFHFPNGYEADIICAPGSMGYRFGLYELAVMFHGYCIYDTPVTDGVLGFLNENEVADTLAAIKALPLRTTL